MKRKTANSKGELNLDLEPVAGAFARAVATGAAREIGCFGTRGNGKTFAALVAMVMHSVEHKAAGYPLPVPWMGATDTHRSHELKTVRTLTHPAWGGLWKLYDSNRVAVARQAQRISFTWTCLRRGPGNEQATHGDVWRLVRGTGAGIRPGYIGRHR